MTFNTSCFSCHVSQLANNYDLQTDTYQTAWAEPGINCETCHGPSAEHMRAVSRTAPPNSPRRPTQADRHQQAHRRAAQRDVRPLPRQDVAADQNFAPGERYFDHFDLAALENADFYPDGRDLGENYTYTQWRLSPCAKSGKLDCIHCHTSSGRYRFRSRRKPTTPACRATRKR